jgi:CobQ/CobB/MinD/ParA family nucleotide binding protein
MKKRLNLILNGKGGVGKSFFAINFIQFLKDRSIKYSGIDTDNANSTLKRFHPDVNFLDISMPTMFDPVFVELNKHSLVVVDCRAASTDLFVSYFAKLEILDVFEKMNTFLTIIFPIGNDPDSLNEIQTLVNHFADKANYVIVKNRFFGEQFTIYDKSKTRIKLLDDLDGKEIEMPVLNDWLVVALNRAKTTITPVLQTDEFTIIDRQRLLIWQRDFYSQIKSVRELLLPIKPPGKDKEDSHE